MTLEEVIRAALVEPTKPNLAELHRLLNPLVPRAPVFSPDDPVEIDVDTNYDGDWASTELTIRLRGTQ